MFLPKVASLKVYKYIFDPKFKKEFDSSYKVDRSYDIPYAGGYSTDGKTIYIDRHFKKMMDGHNIEKYIIVHEKCEKSLINVFGLKYQQAHHIATHYERMIAKEDGVDTNKLEHFVINQFKGLYHEKLTKVPKDLDMTPYKDEKDFHLLKQMIQHE